MFAFVGIVDGGHRFSFRFEGGARLETIHFIHIPKTGGSALQTVLSAVAGPVRFAFHGHLVTLADIPAGERVFFSVRDPIQRFVSGFNSRKRRGRPRYDIEWSPIQAEGFACFADANAMAEALSSPDNDKRLLANTMIRDMLLTGVPLSYWLISPAYWLQRRDDIIGILSQADLPADFERLKRRLNLPAELALPQDAVGAHRNPADMRTDLSPVARGNLESWYAGDQHLYTAALDARGRIWPAADLIEPSTLVMG